mmetsp:Transcript_9878/g.22467  ORF Transcript_9878/g.22467 Transcript_9878/m.22467 type:complete len:448 (-) Transcript_9878:51-1394(-)
MFQATRLACVHILISTTWVASYDLPHKDEGYCDPSQELGRTSLLAISASTERTRVALEAASEDSFKTFLSTHGRHYAQGSEEYEKRRAIFLQRVVEVEKHNAEQGHTWKATINSLADWTDAELTSLRGYKRTPLHGRADAGPALSETGTFRGRGVWAMPEAFSWQGRLAATKEVQDQEACGSCWAFSAVTTLRAHSELFQKDRKFSVQQIVSCVPNPGECGGQGGCFGATVELAFDYVMQKGMAAADDWPYAGSSSDCPEQAMLSMPSVLPQPLNASELFAGARVESAWHSATGAAQIGMVGWSQLPPNTIRPLLEALYTRGPVSVSISAGMEWNMYSYGVLNSCRQDAIVNHAVVLVGYGVDNGLGYWQIQNSWGPNWGEDGFIRIARKVNHTDEEAFCGIDDQPLVGSGCLDGPSQVTVCGTCGILSDAVTPQLSLGPHGWWARH